MLAHVLVRPCALVATVQSACVSTLGTLPPILGRLSRVIGPAPQAKTAKKIWSEVELLTRIQSCPNVARLDSVYEDESAVFIVLELCLGGDLENLVEVLPCHFGRTQIPLPADRLATVRDPACACPKSACLCTL